MSTVRLLLVEDHPIVLKGLQGLVADQRDVEIICQASTFSTAVTLARLHRPDVALLPLRLRGRYSGVGLCRALKAVGIGRVVLYTAFADDLDVAEIVGRGADALISKTSSTEQLLAAIRGERCLPVTCPDAAPISSYASQTSCGLTAREEEVLALLLQRLTNRDIARALTVEVSTVKSHVRHVLRKLGLASRRDLFSSARVSRKGEPGTQIG